MRHAMRAELILGLLLLAGCCTRPERSVALGRPLERPIPLDRPIPLPTRTHRIALAELRRVIDAQVQAHQTAHTQAHTEPKLDAHDAHHIVP
jgi:hypothetical protein